MGRINRRCVICGVSVPFTDNNWRCVIHRISNNKTHRAVGDTRTTNERGYDARYRRMRQRVLERDRYQCMLRLDGCEGRATQADHIIPLSKGGKNTMANLQASCRHCNLSKQADTSNGK